MTMDKKRNKVNWKRRFGILLTVNIVVLFFLAIYIYSPIPEVEIKQSSEQYKKEHSSEFIVRTTKQNVNNLVNAYLDKLLDSTTHEFSIHLDDDVQLFGELPIFSSTVPLLIHFEPIVQDNGDLVLKQKSISVGQMKLPNKKIMQYVSQYLPVPDWVIINPKEEEIYVQVTEMDIKSNFHVAVHQFDLEANNISFQIEVPYKTLGIEQENE
ncbi:MAG TPA: YpmS family protein [Pseudogracilibacillus sp.]|nr:YpmS family protein [Pseudogracilibacillus sp.]